MPLLDNSSPPMKPAEYAEHQILEAILDKSYGPGDALPGERALAQSLGVTRPTLRETLQRLAKEGWVTIAHGKPTRVNDYLAQGGLGILTTLARYGDYLSADMIRHLLRARIMMLPGVAGIAAENDPGALLDYLEGPTPSTDDPVAFARFDWELQLLMVRLAQNPVMRMIFNDFTPVYHVLGERYFTCQKACVGSMDYYRKLTEALRSNPAVVGELVAGCMTDALDLWEAMT
ncbi:MAG TPA: GntR family transcriptional regulator [Desulfobacteraceae bacterium]|nr:GntR family transcriptional regulator [Desulfobacteraceae bacterium]